MKHCHNPSNISSFVANTAAFRAVCGEIEANNGALIPQPILIIGENGSGKTSLLRRLPTKFSDNHFVENNGRFIFDSSDIIKQVAKESILIVDDFDYFLERCAYEEQYRLRRFLYNEGAPMMIAAVSKLTRALTEYKAPFFEGVKKIHLPEISFDEVSDFFDGESKSRAAYLYNLVPQTIGSVELVSQIINSNPDKGKDLELLLSHYSEIYEYIYDDVPINSQRVLNILGGSDTGLTIPEIRVVSGITSGFLTSYLKNLIKRGLVSVDKSVQRKTKYFIKDPLFQIWLKRGR